MIDAAATARAQELIVFAAALDDVGLEDLARRSRMVARDVLDLADQLAAERSARVAIQAERDRLRQMLLVERSIDAA